jgi:Icc protein
MRTTLDAYAVEDTTVQLTWTGLPARRLTVGVGPAGTEVEVGPPAWANRRGRRSVLLSPAPGGPGAALLGGLAPSTTYDVWSQVPGAPRCTYGRITTLAPPPGPELYRLATVSDLHVGERSFGMAGAIRDVHAPSDGVEPYPVRAARAALDEARAWGAGTVVVKGDLTATSRPAQFRTVAALLRDSGMDPLVQLGNHDRRRTVDVAGLLAGIPVATGGRPLVHDLPGVRLVVGDSPSATDRRGHLGAEQIGRIAAAASGAPGAVVVALHHPPERWSVPTSYPPGLVQPDSRRLLAALRGANPATLIIAGHTHRNRTYRIGGQLIAEVGSTKDFPGGWAGYAVHEGGIRQVVRRTARPDVIAWTAATATSLGGIWGWWSPGTIADRCWSHAWPGG